MFWGAGRNVWTKDVMMVCKGILINVASPTT